MDGDCYTEAQCEAVVMCGNNHWIITPNLTRSIQIDLWPGGPKSYLWQPVIASPVIQQTKMEEPQTAVYGWLYVYMCLCRDGGHDTICMALFAHCTCSC